MKPFRRVRPGLTFSAPYINSDTGRFAFVVPTFSSLDDFKKLGRAEKNLVDFFNIW
jgi:hypothetical protein